MPQPSALVKELRVGKAWESHWEWKEGRKEGNVKEGVLKWEEVWEKHNFFLYDETCTGFLDYVWLSYNQEHPWQLVERWWALCHTVVHEEVRLLVVDTFKAAVSTPEVNETFVY